jgi:hypothetical protein
LIAFKASAGEGVVEYEVTGPASGPFALARTECGEPTRTIVDELGTEPTVACVPAALCGAGDTPRRVTLTVDRTSAFGVGLDGARRVTDGNWEGNPSSIPDFLSLGGSMPLQISGNAATLEIVGNAFINLPEGVTTPPNVTVVDINASGAQLSVSGEFALQNGGLCPNCATQPDFYYPERIPDPLRFLPSPSSTVTHPNCPLDTVAGVRRCQPGIYEVEFPPAEGGGGGVKDFELEPGVYILRNGMAINNGSIVGDGVLLYNESGSIDVRGNAGLDLEPATSGMYRDLLIFQARDNQSVFRIQGSGDLATLAGTIYAPAGGRVQLGGGTGDLRVGRVVGAELEVFGTGTVIVDGS